MASKFHQTRNGKLANSKQAHNGQFLHFDGLYYKTNLLFQPMSVPLPSFIKDRWHSKTAQTDLTSRNMFFVAIVIYGKATVMQPIRISINAETIIIWSYRKFGK
jgi:hypothetical protein